MYICICDYWHGNAPGPWIRNSMLWPQVGCNIRLGVSPDQYIYFSAQFKTTVCKSMIVMLQPAFVWGQALHHIGALLVSAVICYQCVQGIWKTGMCYLVWVGTLGQWLGHCWALTSIILWLGHRWTLTSIILWLGHCWALTSIFLWLKIRCFLSNQDMGL